MKNRTVALLAGSVLLLTVISGCTLVGANPKPATPGEKYLFEVVTNYVTVPVIVKQTEIVTQTNYVVQVVTNEVGQTVFNTNTFTFVVTNTVTSTNWVQKEQDTLTTKPSVVAGVQGAGSVLDSFLPGTGGMVVYGILAALAIWGHLRSSKNGTTAANLAQEIETIREFIKQLPNGVSYDAAITSFLQSHQMEAGIANQVMALLKGKVSSPEAKAALDQILSTLQVLTPKT